MLTAVCAFPKALETIAAQHVACVNRERSGCFLKRQFVRFLPPLSHDSLLYRMTMHNSCECNELIGVTNRVLGEVPMPSAKGLRYLRAARTKITGKLPKVAEIGPWDVVAKMTGRRQRRYAEAAQLLSWSPVEARDALIKAFVKAEKIDPGAKNNPDPRIIQFRGAKYTLRLMQYLKPTERALYQLAGPTGLRMIAKGLNNRQRAATIVEKFDQFRDCVVYSLDGSRWDKHITPKILQLEHSVYLAMHGNDPELARLLSWQIKNRCFTNGGISYTAMGNRMSGDANTALGNCLLMCIMATAAMSQLRVRKWDIFDDGDDCLLFIPKSEEVKLSQLPQVFLGFGQELKLENRATTVEKVLFCQHQPVLLGDGSWTMVQNPRKVMSTRAGGTSHWTNPRLFRGMLHATGLCELALSRGVPILQEYASALLRMGDGTVPKAFRDDLEVWTRAVRMGELSERTQTISLMARESFADAFGIGIIEQLQVESELRQWCLDPKFQYQLRDPEFSHGWQQDADLRCT